MGISSQSLVELVLLGPANDRRQLQDSPILGDVWAAYGANPTDRIDLLITPHMTWAAGPVATLVSKRIAQLESEHKAALVAYLQGVVAAKLTFAELLRVVVPMTTWWQDKGVQAKLSQLVENSALDKVIGAVLDYVTNVQGNEFDKQARYARELAAFSAVQRYMALAGIILWAGTKKRRGQAPEGFLAELAKVKSPREVMRPLLALFKDLVSDLKELESLYQAVVPSGRPAKAPIYLVTLNRRAMPALERSVAAVKADASRTLFKVRCREIRWAVLDSGIDGAHPAFRDDDGASRVRRTLDFGNLRKIVCLDNQNPKTTEFQQRLKELMAGRRFGGGGAKAERKRATEYLVALAEDASNDRPIHWELAEKFIALDPNDPAASSHFSSGHGTHVAGIIGGRRQATAEGVDPSWFDGMCPDISLYDFRVLGNTLEETEFAIIGALQYIRYLNERSGFIQVHGANLSLSILHDVRNYACGRTPICNECERLIESGVVVVAAAGNQGHHSFETANGRYEGYMAFSITDPGNADSVITVGATHRFWPHTYGVSFFSSRGPTGDGRMKPDLVAPGERIFSVLPGNDAGALDGTSMAAPHVSGAAAMLMARYSELIGQPRKIKRILCESATDLNRERTFQGHGMLDVLRAFQKI